MIQPLNNKEPLKMRFEHLKRRIENSDCPALSEIMELRQFNSVSSQPPPVPLLRTSTTYESQNVIRKASTFESKLPTIQQELESSYCTGYYRQILELVIEKKDSFLQQDQDRRKKERLDIHQICYESGSGSIMHSDSEDGSREAENMDSDDHDIQDVIHVDEGSDIETISIDYDPDSDHSE